MPKRLVVIAFLVVFLLPSISYAWDDCPNGNINDTYPGDCGRYIDTNKDGICDHSQQKPDTLSNNSEEEIADNQEEIEEGEQGGGTNHLLMILSSTLLVGAIMAGIILYPRKTS